MLYRLDVINHVVVTKQNGRKITRDSVLTRLELEKTMRKFLNERIKKTFADVVKSNGYEYWQDEITRLKEQAQADVTAVSQDKDTQVSRTISVNGRPIFTYKIEDHYFQERKDARQNQLIEELKAKVLDLTAQLAGAKPSINTLETLTPEAHERIDKRIAAFKEKLERGEFEKGAPQETPVTPPKQTTQPKKGNPPPSKKGRRNKRGKRK